MIQTIRTALVVLALLFAGWPHASMAQQTTMPSGTADQPAVPDWVQLHAQAQAQAQAQADADARAAAQAEKQKQMYTVAGVPATYENVLKAAIRFGAVDMSSDQAIDDFAKVEYCDMYQRLHNDEFDWRRVRTALREVIARDKPNYPSTLYLERNEEFGEYDFASGMLELKPQSVLNSRRLMLTGNNYIPGFCDSQVSFPSVIVAELSEPMRLDGVELTEDEAKAVVAGISTQVGSARRVAYGRFTITITGAHQTHKSDMARLDATLQNITLYEDAQFSRPFWSGLNSAEVFRTVNQTMGEIPFKGIDPQQDADPANTKPLTVMGANGTPLPTPKN